MQNTTHYSLEWHKKEKNIAWCIKKITKVVIFLRLRLL